MTPSADTAQLIESTLRNHGHPARLAWMADIDEVEQAMQFQHPHLVVVDIHLEPEVRSRVAKRRDETAPDTPIVYWAPSHSLAHAHKAACDGASGLVTTDSPAALSHLERVIAQQIDQQHQNSTLRHLRERLAQIERHNVTLMAETQDAVLRVQEGIVVECNPAFLALLQRTTDVDVLGSPVMNLIAAEDQPLVKRTLNRLADLPTQPSTELPPLNCHLLTANKSSVAVALQLSHSVFEAAPCLDLIIRDPVEAGVPAAQGATRDRTALNEAIERFSANARPTLLMVAVEKFDALEKTIGYLSIEALMQHADQWLAEQLSPKDQLFRTGPSEWVVLLNEHPLAELANWMDQLQGHSSRQLFQSSRHESYLTLNIAAFPLSKDDRVHTALNTLMVAVRELASEQGTHCRILGSQADTAVALKSQEEQANAVRTALENDAFHLVFQSITSLQGESVHPHDVLIRMTDSQGNELPAGRFIEAARRYRLGMAIDKWVTTKTLALLRKRDSRDAPPLVIKLSEQTLVEADDYLDWLTQTQALPFTPGTVIFGLRESEVEKRIKQSVALVKRLRDTGAEVMMEHFGLSAHALQLLDHLPVQYIKFAPVFTQRMEQPEYHQQLKHLLEIAHQRKIKSIVCHVESARAMAQLWQMGVNYIQGYGVQEPEVVLLSA